MENIKKAVEKYSEIMDKAQDYIWKNPEVGYKEFKTNEYMLKAFAELGYKTERPKDITGFTAYYDTGKVGPTVLVLAELDSLICAQHPECDKQTGAVHNCGHHLQCASILGVAGAIKEESVSNELCGKVKFCIVPAEEGIEIGYRSGLVEQGIISFTSGKPEFISRGMLEDVDVAFMVHTSNGSKYNDTVYHFDLGSNGVIRKKTVIMGKAAHAGGDPHNGINALYASELCFSACNALRETFKDDDHIRFHSIITNGGDAVNAIPEKVVIESYVRGANAKALNEANYKINRAITGACLAIGAKVEITDMAGSEPLFGSPLLTSLMDEVGIKLAGEKKSEIFNVWLTSSTDMGDVSSLVPSVHAYVDASLGEQHGKDFVVKNPLKTCVDSANLQVATLVELLKDGGEKVNEIKKEYNPTYSSTAEYLEGKKAINKTMKCIEYQGENISINLK